MPFVLADRVQETTINTSGTGDLTLNGPSRQMQSFLAGIGNGNTTDICILDGNGRDWEVDKDAVLSSNTILSRGTFAASSTGAQLALSAHTHLVFATVPAERYIDLDNIEWNAGSVVAIGSGLTLASGTLSAPAPAQEWTAGTVSAIGSGITLASGTLSVPAPAQEWTAGTVTTIGSGITLASGTISASAGSGTAALTSYQAVQSAPVTINPVPTTYTALAGVAITLPASATARTVLVSSQIYCSNVGAFAVGMDGSVTLVPPGGFEAGGNYTAAGGLPANLCASLITVPGDNATHTLQLYYQAAHDTNSRTYSSGVITAVVIG